MESCLSPDNFDLVCRFLEIEMAKYNTGYYQHGDFQIFLKNRSSIHIKNNEYTISSITKDHGVFSLAKNNADQERIADITNAIFCKLVASARG